jgi:hypothetical protein
LVSGNAATQHPAGAIRKETDAEVAAGLPAATLAHPDRVGRRFGEHPRVVTDIQMNCLWWDRLELMYQAEQAVWRIFCGGQISPEQNKLYAKFRKLLLEGSKLKADA